MASVLSIGWDVRGWRGSKQAVAALRLDVGAPQIEWLEVSSYFRFPPGEVVQVASLLSAFNGAAIQEAVSDVDQIVVAIDAPLAFPDQFRRHLNDPQSAPVAAESEIENRLAYRDCERWVADEFWKPLSAAFDKLGNNATLAMALARNLRKDGFGVIPFDSGDFDRRVLEVYPGIVKDAKRKDAPAIPPVHHLLPDELELGTDRYDAAICAVLGLVFVVGGARVGLPDLVHPPEDFPRTETEGWIYGLPAELVLRFH